MEHPLIIVALIVQNFLMSFFIAGYIFRFSSIKRHVLLGIFGGILVYLTRSTVRLLGLPIGINTLVSLVLSIPLYKMIFKINNWKEPSLISVLAYIMVLFVEVLTLGYTLNLYSATPDIMLTSPSIHFKVGMIQNIWIFIFIGLFITSSILFRKWKGNSIGNK